MALHNPTLEAAARIKFATGESWASLYFCRTWAANNQDAARALLKVAADHIDFLRSIDALPPAPAAPSDPPSGAGQ
ncbi:MULTISPECIES: hypothetical protein [unclassified Acidocella]|uniref:hypothetical protein n=1 Tax=unclassified Acidocella TaxID=2648610 RepID=UPI00028E6A7B|nr:MULTISPECIES: hypothetical protein [unclassified Acidocella]EKN01088.1 hypothetical protein MXAZACID_02244 [Acidocella sp. MX-AZ02]WBO60585.1 hypothetical protein GT370_07380 [Acidocella sp. MX-AZ03]